MASEQPSSTPGRDRCTRATASVRPSSMSGRTASKETLLLPSCTVARPPTYFSNQVGPLHKARAIEGFDKIGIVSHIKHGNDFLQVLSQSYFRSIEVFDIMQIQKLII